MEFFLAFQQAPTAPSEQADPEAVARRQQLGLAWRQYMGAMAGAGVLLASKRLSMSNSVIVGCDPAASPGLPHGANAMQLGGFALIDVPTLTEALAWAERSPSNQSGCTQVLPVLPTPGPASREAP